MYLMLTNKCNMTCPHCCYECSPKNNDFMSIKTFKNAIDFQDKIYEKLGYYFHSIALGGGEPTLHPNFKEFLIYLLIREIKEESLFDYYEELQNNFYSIFIATNGTNKRLTLWLLSLALKKYIYLALSLDFFHDLTQVSDKIIFLFEKYSSSFNNIEIRNVEKGVKKAGRAKKNNLFTMEGCVCPGLFITPKGDLKLCGCENSSILGNINNKDFINDFITFLEENIDDCYYFLEECENYIKDEKVEIYENLIKKFKGEKKYLILDSNFENDNKNDKMFLIKEIFFFDNNKEKENNIDINLFI